MSAASTKRARHAGRRTKPCAAVATAVTARSPSAVSGDDPYPARIGRAQSERAGGDPFHARMQAPGARLELQAPVFHVELARALVLALELREQLAGLVL